MLFNKDNSANGAASPVKVTGSAGNSSSDSVQAASSKPNTHYPFAIRVDSVSVNPPLVSLTRTADDLSCSFFGTSSAKPTYKAEEVVNIRGAAKLGAKFFAPKQDRLFQSKSLSLCNHAFDVGLILCLAGERKELVVAGILSNSLEEQLKKDVNSVRQTIGRKFGKEVLSLIEAVTGSDKADSPGWFSRQLAYFMEARADNRDVATIDCAIKISIASTANNLIEDGVPLQNWPQRLFEGTLVNKDARFTTDALENNLAQYTKEKVPLSMLIQLEKELSRLKKNLFGSEQELKVCIIPANERDERYSRFSAMAEDARLIRLAAEYSSALFENTPRKWGPTETLPLSAHQFEVGMLLAMSGCSKESIIAGFLHDLYEGYIEIDREKIRPQILKTFGSRVCELIDSVTEPPKEDKPSNWWDRKQTVLQYLEAGGSETATLCCATKISTLAAGNKFLYSGADIRQWSSGSMEDNARLFRMYLEIFERKGVPESLIDQFKFELNRFESHMHR
jgi:hypothetical protein